MSSHHKKIRSFLYFILGIVLLIFSVNVFFSVALNKRLTLIRHLVSESAGFSFNFRFAYFDLFRGLVISGLQLDKDTEVIIAAKRLDIGFDLLSLLKREISVKNIYVRQLHLYPNKIPDLNILLKGLTGKVDKSIGFFETVYFDCDDVWLGDYLRLDIGGYLSMVKGNLLISRGDLLLKKIEGPVATETDFFRGSHFYKPFDYVFEAQTEDSDFVISRCEFSNPSLKFIGNGRIQNIKSNPQMTFEMDFLNILLDDFPSLNLENVKSRGVVDAQLKVSGPVSDLTSVLSMKITNTQFTLFDSLFVTGVNGSAIFTKNHLSSHDLSLSVNGVPLTADFAVYQETDPRVLLQLSSLSRVSGNPAFVLNLSADWVESELVGKLKTRIRYNTKDTSNTMDLDLKNFHIGYEDELFVNAQNLDAGLLAEPLQGKAGATKASHWGLSLEQFFCVVRSQNDGIAFDPLKAVCYGGTLEGQIQLATQNDRLSVKGEGHLRGVDLNEIFSKSNEAPYVLLGKLDADLKLDNTLKEMFKGQLFVTKGVIEQNPILNAVADFLGVASLKKISFDELSMLFSGGWGDYTSQAKLNSPQVTGFLDSKVSSYDTIDGYLTVTIATELLNESKQFKKILTYIRHGEPSVVFPFKISSYIKSPRVLWLKNEFKDKLQNLLPESNKRFLQRQVNSMVEKIKEE